MNVLSSNGGRDICIEPYTRLQYLELVQDWPDLTSAESLNVHPSLFRQWYEQFCFSKN